MAAPVLIYVAEEHWQAGQGHQTRCQALVEAFAARGIKAERTDQPPGDLWLDDGGNAVVYGEVLDGLAYQPLRRYFLDARTGVPVPPSTTALEHICMGIPVTLLPARNAGEERLLAQLAPLSDAEREYVVDGLGAQRVVERYCYRSVASTDTGTGSATVR